MTRSKRTSRHQGTVAPPGLLPDLARFLGDLLHLQAVMLSATACILSDAARALARGWRVVPAVAGAGLTVLLCTGACGPFDLSCKINAWQTGWLEGLNAAFASVTQSMIEGVFTSSMSTLGTASWNVGIATVNRLGAVMAIVVVALCAVQIIMTLAARQRSGVTRAVFGALLAWPVCAASVWLAIRLVTVADGLADVVIESSTALTSLSRLVDLAWVGSIVTGNPVGVAMVSLFFLFMVFIPTVLLTFVMAFRNYALVVAVAVAPVSLMVWGLEPLRGMARGWLKVTTALMLTKPVMAIALIIAGEMVEAGLTSGGIGPFMTGVVGLLSAAFAPFLAMGMVTGAMAIGDAVAARGIEQRLGRTGAAAAQRGARGLGRLGWEKSKPHLSGAASGIRSRLGPRIASFGDSTGAERANAGPLADSGDQGSRTRPERSGTPASAAVDTTGEVAGSVAGSVLPGAGTAGALVGRRGGRAIAEGARRASDAVHRVRPGHGAQGAGHRGDGLTSERRLERPGVAARQAGQPVGGVTGEGADGVPGSVGPRASNAAGPPRRAAVPAAGQSADVVTGVTGQGHGASAAATDQPAEGVPPGWPSAVEPPARRGTGRESSVAGGANLMEGLQ